MFPKLDDLDTLKRINNALLLMKMIFGFWPVFFYSGTGLWGGWFAALVWILAGMLFIWQDNNYVDRKIRMEIQHERILRDLRYRGHF